MRFCALASPAVVRQVTDKRKTRLSRLMGISTPPKFSKLYHHGRYPAQIPQAQECAPNRRGAYFELRSNACRYSGTVTGQLNLLVTAPWNDSSALGSPFTRNVWGGG